MRPQCVFCKDEFQKAGKLLKCLHKVCNDCLPACSEQDGRIHCAKCRRPTPCPPPGRNHEQLLADDSMFDNVPRDDAARRKEAASDQHLGIPANGNTNSLTDQSGSSNAVDVSLFPLHAQGLQKHIHPQRRPHLCPFHSKMDIRYYCSTCREVLCETCKLQSKHASHVEQITDTSTAAAELRHRLTERMRNFNAKKRGKEEEKSLKYAGDLLEAFDIDVARQLADIKRLINKQCDELLQTVCKRKEEVLTEAEMRSKQQAALQTQCLVEYRRAMYQAKEVQNITEGVQSKQDFLKVHPPLIKVLASAVRIKRHLQTRISRFVPTNLSILESNLAATCKVVNNTDIDLSRCSFAHNLRRVLSVGDDLEVTAVVRNWKGQQLSISALKASSIRIWASTIQGRFFLTAAQVPVPIIGYSEGMVHARFEFDSSHDAVFLLEIILDAPYPFRTLDLETMQSTSGSSRIEMLGFESRARLFHSNSELTCSYYGFSNESKTFPIVGMQQLKNGIATIRALEPIQERHFAVTIEIRQCASDKLDIGFAWGCEDAPQDMKLVVASSAIELLFPTPIHGCVAGDRITVSRCATSVLRYDIHHRASDGSVKNEHEVFIDPVKRPILTIRMFQSGTELHIYSKQD
eukprot:scpid55280/ scgid19936/ 